MSPTVQHIKMVNSGLCTQNFFLQKSHESGLLPNIVSAATNKSCTKTPPVSEKTYFQLTVYGIIGP